MSVTSPAAHSCALSDHCSPLRGCPLRLHSRRVRSAFVLWFLSSHCRGLTPFIPTVTMRSFAVRLGLACLLAVACSAMLASAAESSSEALQLTPELDAEYNLQPLTHSEEQDVEMELQELGVRTTTRHSAASAPGAALALAIGH